MRGSDRGSVSSGHYEVLLLVYHIGIIALLLYSIY